MVLLGAQTVRLALTNLQLLACAIPPMTLFAKMPWIVLLACIPISP